MTPHIPFYRVCISLIPIIAPLTREDQGQGGAQAIEDAAAITAVFPLGTLPEEIHDRLTLYQQCRYERASTIQEWSRLKGLDQAARVAVEAKYSIDSACYSVPPTLRALTEGKRNGKQYE